MGERAVQHVADDFHVAVRVGTETLAALHPVFVDDAQGGKGFGAHPHRDMEIISYVLDGSLAHRDSMGNGTRIVPGEVQRMSAGTGVVHSEYNHEPGQTTHFLQIWVIPDTQGLEPSYEQKAFPEVEKRGRLRLVASPDQAEGSVRVHQDMRMYSGLFDAGEHASLDLAPGRLAYVHMARGTASVNGHELGAGDALLYADEPRVQIEHGDGAEILVFDLPRLQ